MNKQHGVRTALAALVAASLMAVVPPAVGAARGTGAARASSADPKAAAGVGLAPAYTRHGSNLVRLQVGAFDPLADPVPVPAGQTLVDEATLPPTTAQYWLVQAKIGQFGEAVAAIEAAGGHVSSAIPDSTYLVRATPAQRLAFAASPAVRWSTYYQSAWRMPSAWGPYVSLISLQGQQTYQVSAFRDSPDPAAVGRALAAIAGVTVVNDDVPVFDVTATAAQLPAIASIPAVEWVTLKPTFVPQNTNARWVIDTGERDQLDATAPGRLTGAGQTAAVADTSPNYKPDKTGAAHVSFRDCNGNDLSTCKEADYTLTTPGKTSIATTAHGTNHRKMAAFFDLGEAGPNPTDESAHGTHVSGSVNGDAGTYGIADGHDGLAPAARLVHQGIADKAGALTGLPSNYYNLFRMAYRPRNPSSVSDAQSPDAGNGQGLADYVPTEDARTHNNSYGSGLPLVDPFAQGIAIDRFVWDHEDMNVVVSASNAGPAAGTTASPAIGKNNFSSGATSNGRQPMVSIGNMAQFSGHGPTADGRFGPTIGTPGEIVIGPKGGTNDQYHHLQGTSMSGPILTGALTLMRQYFWDGYGPINGKGFAAGAPDASRKWNPSAALVRAAAINGAERMRGWYTGEDGNRRELDGQWPSAGQGFGRMNLSNSLYFAGDPTNNWYHDVWRDDPAAFSFTSPTPRTYTLNVAAGQPLDVSLAWTDAPDALPAGTPGLVNDLDLVVTGPGGIYVGNNMNSRTQPSVAEGETRVGQANPDTSNNNERVRIANPGAGTYTVTVTAARLLDQNQGFALAASGLVSGAAVAPAPAPPAFVPGPARHVDVAGAPTVSGVTVEAASNDVAKLRFTTNEPTSATASLIGPDGATTFTDVYNLGGTVNQPSTFSGMETAPVETGPDYANKPVISKNHEILLTGLKPGTSYRVVVQATDRAEPNRLQSALVGVDYTSPVNVFQPEARDIGQLATSGDQWKVGKQLYAGDDPGGSGSLLGAFMFRLPSTLDPTTITGAIVEMTAMHDLSNHANVDPRFTVDLLDDTVKNGWGSTQTYNSVHKAPSRATVLPQTTVRDGGGTKLAFTFGCNDVEALRASLSTVVGGQRLAPFRWDSTHPGETSLVSTEFGFNRRSQGPQQRPKLILLTGPSSPVPPFTTCDAAAPAPAISDVRIDNSWSEEGANVFSQNGITVSWRTDRESDSLVLFRPKGESEWRQVGTPARTSLHQVRVTGIDTNQHYEFAVRSTGCNGASTTADNAGAGWDLFRPVPQPTEISGTATPVITYNWDTDDQGWTKTVGPEPQGAAQTQWTRKGPGADSTPMMQSAEPYGDINPAFLTSPAIAIPGTAMSVDFKARWDLEQATPATSTNDALQVEYSTDGGASWTVAAKYQGKSENHPTFVARSVKFFAPGGSAKVRFTLTTDDNISTPPFQGAAVDQVAIASYNAAAPTSDPFVTGVGPVVPKSAGATNLNAASVVARTVPTAADIAAGTGICNPRTASPGGTTTTTATAPTTTTTSAPTTSAPTTTSPSSTTTTSTTQPPTTGGTTNSQTSGSGTTTPAPARNGYWLASATGTVVAFGEAQNFGSMAGKGLKAPIIAIVSTVSGNGYWLLASDGGIFAFGDAGFFGSTGASRLNAPVVGMAPTPTGRGYWLVASDGGIFSFGDAQFAGSMGGKPLNRAVISITSVGSGKGYWLLASDGGIFSFGDARFFGSTGGITLVKPVVGMTRTATGSGYWLVASDGGIFSFGDSDFRGSMGGKPLNRPIVGMVRFGNGYLLVASDGGVFNFSERPFSGSLGGTPPADPIVGVASLGA